ncbi:uncharacterized protein LOC134542200 isoform X2 [Bacillus rossius redtenbacheri]|uniref:uncharacterized protein LOC134542200 isoform X2 n=1 Tax=Bacillus rossius redtenbacheri TaxID=93214 RepID=UPI002FDCA577
MSSPESAPALEISHKPQQSHDSGAYIDWNSEDSGSSPIMMAADSNVTGEFVTVVAVESGGDPGCGEPADDSEEGRLSPETPFVTVLSIGDDVRKAEEPPQKICVSVPAVDDAPSRPTSIQLGQTGDDVKDRIEEVFVYRLPGERLGFGLKFEGGTKTAEKVRRLFIQSCAPDSPASRAECSWGRLADGDEVLEVDGAPVAGMTRVDCVRCLKESHVVLRLTVRHSTERTSPTSPVVVSAEMKKSSTPPPPPPIPPRKIPRKPPPSPTKIKPPPTSVVVPPKGFADADYVNMESETPTKENTDNAAETKPPPATSTPKLQQRFPKIPLKLSLSGSPELTRGLGRRAAALDSVPFPPEAEVYLDLFALEEMSRLNGESESDDTGSSISTVLPTTCNSSFSDLRSSASSTCDAVTPLSTPGGIDVTRVLDPFEQLERELAATGDDDFLFAKFVSSQQPAAATSEQVTVVAGSSTTVVDDEALALQPPLSFQDAPLSYGDERVNSTLKDVVDKINELEIMRSENALEDRDEQYDSARRQTESFLAHEIEASAVYGHASTESPSNGSAQTNAEVKAEHVDIPALPPRPSPRKDAPAGKFKSGKKRPPPPPPPRGDRPQAPQPAPRDARGDELAARIEKMFDMELSEAPPSPAASTTGEVDSAGDGVVMPEVAITDVPETSQEETPLDDPRGKVEEVPTGPDESDHEKNCDRAEVDLLDKEDLQVSLVDSEGDDARVFEDDDEEDLLPPGFEDCAMLSPSEAFFPFRWTMTSHLATIGEAEEEDEGEAACGGEQSVVPTSAAAAGVESEGRPGHGDEDDDDASAAARGPAEPDLAGRVSPSEQRRQLQTTDEGSMQRADAARPAQEAPGSPRREGETAAAVEMAPVDVCTPTDSDLSRKIEPRPRAESSSDASSEPEAVRGADAEHVTTPAEKATPDLDGVRGTMDAILALDTLTAPTKPLSPTLSPPPSFSRLPPDGHEFPPNYQEPGHFNVGVPAVIEMDLSAEPILKEAVPAAPPPLPASGPPARKASQRPDGDAPPPPARKFSEDLGSSRPRVSSWRKDEKSERSVRDKIAMFSSAQDSPTRRASKGSSEDVFACDDPDFADSARKPPSRTPSYRSSQAPQPAFGRRSSAMIYNSMTDVYSNAALENGEPPTSLDFNSRTQSSLDLTSSSSSAYSSSGSPDSSLSYGVGYASTLPRKLGAARQPQSVSSGKYSDLGEKPVSLTRATSFSGGNTLHTRSQSLVDIVSIPFTGKRNSISAIGGTRPSEDMRRASLNALIEQRRRGISKLRGLVIPEKVAEISSTQPIIDLPEIKSRDSILATKPPVVSHKDDQKPSHRRWSTSTDSIADRSTASHLISSPPWKSQSPSANLPKYSPAFKRKSLAVYGALSSASSVSSSLSSSREELRPIFDGSNAQKSSPPLPPSKPPRQFVGNFTQSYGSSLLSQPEPPKSLESITSPTRSDMSFEYVSSCGSSPDLRINAPAMIKDDFVKKINNGHVMNGNMYINGSKTTGLSPNGKVLSSDNGRSEDDSDNDSAVSSSRSSTSHGFSPPASPLPDNRTVTEDSQRHHTLHASILSPGSTGENRPLRRTLSSETTASIASSTTSTLTSGSQASCSSNGGSSSGSDSKRVLKAQSVEAINRKNVLSSARYSSGKDYKIGSPLIQRKFEEDMEKQKLLNSRGDLSLNEMTHNGGDGEIQCKNSNSAEKLYELSNNATVPPGNSPKDVILYKTPDLNDVPNENSILYFEVQENESFDETDNPDDTVIEVSDKPNKLAPLPAPRNSNNQTPVKSNSTTVADEVSVTSDRWAELTKKYSKNQESKNDEIDRVLNPNNQFISKPEESEQEVEIYSDKNFKKKEFTLDLKNNTLVLNSEIPNKSDEDSSSGEKSPISPVDSYSSGKTITIENSVSPPAVPPKPIQRRNVQNETNLTGDKQESDLMTILTGRSRDQTPLQLRERRRSKDLDGLRPISMTIERSVSSEEVLPNGGVRTVKTVEQFQEIVSSPTSKIPTAAMRHGSNRRSVSVNDIRKAFEKAELALANTGRANGTKTSSVITSSNGIANHHARVSSLDSTTSDDSYAAIPGYCGSVSTLQKEQFGSVTSIASSTSLISQQELQSLIDEANQVLEESGSCPSPVYEVLVVVLHREMAGGSIGITLAGGADYESKEITVHKVLNGSPADKDGRIQKGDRILSINGKSMKGVTHREALNILKAPRTEVVLVVSRSRPDYDGAAPVEELSAASVRASLSAASSRPPRIPEQPVDTTANSQTEDVIPEVSRGPPVVVTLLKDGAGLGFSLEGGKDSPVGDRALTIKKIFTGGCAEKNGTLVAGDELLNVNGTDVTAMSRIEAWSLMKRLPDGNVSLTVRQKVTK